MHSRDILATLVLLLLFLFSIRVDAFPLMGDKKIKKAKKLWKQGQYMKSLALLRERWAEGRGKNARKAARELLKLAKETPAPAEKQMEEMCNKGDADACADLGWIHCSRHDGSIGAEYLHKACEYGDMMSCNTLGMMYVGSIRVLQPNCQKAFYFFSKACNNNLACSCHNLGVIYRDGCGKIKKNKELSRKYYKKACKLGSKEACKELRPLWRKIIGF